MTIMSALTKTPAFALCFCLAFASKADVYKWVDDEGSVHYSDRKPADAESTQIKTRKQTSARSVGAEGSLTTQQNLDAQLQSLQEAGEIQQLEERQQEKLVSNNKAMEEYCASLKISIDTLASNARLRTKGDDGELRFMSAEEIVKKRNRNQQSYQAKCL